MPFFVSQRPNTLARCTSHAARYVHAPSRKYSCSTRVARPDAGASVGCLRRGLNAAFFVRGDDEFTGREWASLPDTIIEIEDAPGLGREVGIAWEDPTAISLRTESIGAKPAPQSRPADLRYQALSDHFAPNLRKRKSRQWQLQAMGKFTSKSLNLDDDAGGKTGRVARREAAPRGRDAARGQSACAIC